MSYKILAEYRVKTRLSQSEVQKMIELCKKHGLEKVKRVCEELMARNAKVTVKELEKMLEK